MFATMQLLVGLGLGMGRSAVLVDAALTAVALVVGAVLIIRARRAQPPTTAAADPAAEVVAEAEAVTAGAGAHQPV